MAVSTPQVLEALRRSGLHALVLGADLGGYFWLRHDYGVFLLPRVGWRGRHRSGLQGEFSAHLGYLQSLLASPAFSVSQPSGAPSLDSAVIDASRVGTANLMVGVTTGVGWFIPRIGVTPFVRAGAYWHYPVFDQTLLRFTMTIGAEVRL